MAHSMPMAGGVSPGPVYGANRGVLNGMGEFLLSLVRRGASEQQWADWLKVPFEHAVHIRDMSTVRRLLEAGANGPKVRPRGGQRHTLLHVAAASGNVKVVNALLQCGSVADLVVREPGDRGYTPLHRAALMGHGDVCRILIKAGADKEARSSSSKATALHLAARKGHNHCVRALLLTGANRNARRSSDGATPLHQAAFFGQMGAVRALLEGVADPNSRDIEGCTPLFLAAQEGHEQIVEDLIRNGSNPDIGREDGWTPLHAAARFGHHATAVAILRGGADPEAQTHDHGSTPLHVAAISGFDEVLQVLLEAGSDIEHRDTGGWTPLHCACAAARPSCVAGLVSRGADTASMTADGQDVASLVGTDISEGEVPSEETNESILRMLRVWQGEIKQNRQRLSPSAKRVKDPEFANGNTSPVAAGGKPSGGIEVGHMQADGHSGRVVEGGGGSSRNGAGGWIRPKSDDLTPTGIGMIVTGGMFDGSGSEQDRVAVSTGGKVGEGRGSRGSGGGNKACRPPPPYDQSVPQLSKGIPPPPYSRDHKVASGDRGMGGGGGTRSVLISSGSAGRKTVPVKERAASDDVGSGGWTESVTPTVSVAGSGSNISREHAGSGGGSVKGMHMQAPEQTGEGGEGDDVDMNGAFCGNDEREGDSGDKVKGPSSCSGGDGDGDGDGGVAEEAVAKSPISTVGSVVENAVEAEEVGGEKEIVMESTVLMPLNTSLSTEETTLTPVAEAMALAVTKEPEDKAPEQSPASPRGDGLPSATKATGRGRGRMGVPGGIGKVIARFESMSGVPASPRHAMPDPTPTDNAK